MMCQILRRTDFRLSNVDGQARRRPAAASSLPLAMPVLAFVIAPLFDPADLSQRLWRRVVHDWGGKKPPLRLLRHSRPALCRGGVHVLYVATFLTVAHSSVAPMPANCRPLHQREPHGTGQTEG